MQLMVFDIIQAIGLQLIDQAICEKFKAEELAFMVAQIQYFIKTLCNFDKNPIITASDDMAGANNIPFQSNRSNSEAID